MEDDLNIRQIEDKLYFFLNGMKFLSRHSWCSYPQLDLSLAQLIFSMFHILLTNKKCFNKIFF